jgi:hypothetical protein
MPHPTVPVAVRHPETSEYVALNPAIDYPDDDVFVKTYPWAFVRQAEKGKRDSVRIESASAEPGQKRRTRAK